MITSDDLVPGRVIIRAVVPTTFNGQRQYEPSLIIESREFDDRRRRASPPQTQWKLIVLYFAGDFEEVIINEASFPQWKVLI